MPRWQERTGLGLAVAITCGCTGIDAPSASAVVRDSAGIAIVENTQPHPSAVIAWSLESSPFIEVGRTDGDGADVFGSVRDVVALEGGGLAVADAMAREVRIFNPAGEHRVTLGRPGAGPGEFSSVWDIAQLAPDSFAVIDNLGGRVSLFGRDGTFVRSYPIARMDGAAAPNAAGWLDDGSLVVTALVRTTDGERRDRSRIVVYLVDPEGGISRSLGEFEDRELGRNGLGLGFGGHAVVAADDSLIWYGHNARFDVRAYAPEGSVRRIVRLDRAPRAVTEGEIGEARAIVEESLKRQGASGPVAERIRQTEFSDTHPAHGRLLIDSQGYLWVAQARSQLVTGTARAELAEEWDIFDPAGRLAGRLATPVGFELTDTRQDLVVGVHTDSLGVQRVRGYRLDREGERAP